MNEPDPARGGAMRREDPDFLERCYRRVLGELGYSAEHAAVLAELRSRR